MSQASDTSQQTTPTCALGLTSADLSAWRDETLAPDETARIGAHSESCLACRQRLRGFATLAATLQAQQVPAPDERLWQAVLVAVSADATERRTTSDDTITGAYLVPDQSGNRNPKSQSHVPPRSWRRRALGTLAAVAAIALVVVGFARLFQSGMSNRPQPFQLHWRQVKLPDAITANPGANAMLSVFPADGSIAWLCQSGTKPAPGPLRIWRTNDGGATWKAVAVARIDKAFSCEITPDQLDPDVAALSYGFIPNKAVTIQGDNLITFDGGASWHEAPYFQLNREFATLNGAIYAIRSDDTNTNHLMVSRDGAQTWNSIDNTLYSQKLLSDYFWINPTTGALLVETHSAANKDGFFSFWMADGRGANWRKIGELPVGDMAAIPASDGGWSICTLVEGVSGDPQHPDFHSHVYCGTDHGGWNERPGLDILRSSSTTPSVCAGCGQSPNSSAYGAISLVGVGNDGAVLATVENRFDAKGDTTKSGLYRLPAGSSQWQNGGETPGTPGIEVVTYAPRPGGGIFWSMPVAPPLGGQAPASVFTASYPGPATTPLPTPSQQTPTPAGNVDQGAPLAWQPIATPTGFQPRLTSTNILAVAPSDGRTAYACAQPNADPPAKPLRGWVTHDGGASWSTLALPQVAGWCSLVVDEVNPRDVLLGFSHNPPGNPPDLYYRSTDGGDTWRDIPGLDGSVVYQFASYRGAVYMLRDATPGSVGDFARVQVSTDGMIGWRTIDDPFFSSDTSAAQFWLNPFNGELLASDIPGPVYGIPLSSATSALILRSSDGGAHWHDLGAPPTQPGGASNVFVQPPQANHAWGVCVANTSDAAVSVECVDDNDQRWHSMPALNTGSTTRLPRYTTYTSDGAILAVVATTSSGATTYNVYRLPSGANRWQALGPTPEFSLLYAPTANGNGMLWSVPVNGIVADAQGRVFAVTAP